MKHTYAMSRPTYTKNAMPHDHPSATATPQEDAISRSDSGCWGFNIAEQQYENAIARWFLAALSQAMLH